MTALQLAEAWRLKASTLDVRYRTRDWVPVQAQAAIAALETCAAELEELCNEELRMKNVESNTNTNPS